MGAENVESLRSYLAELKAEGKQLPLRNGRPDKSAIATACGFDRQTFYNNPEAIALLNEASEEIESVREGTPTGGRAAHLEKLMTNRERRIQHLEEQLQSRTAEAAELRGENAELRRENKELKERLRQYEIAEEVMTTTGRKYRP